MSCYASDFRRKKSWQIKSLSQPTELLLCIRNVMEKDAKNLSSCSERQRKDLNDLFVFTIDPEGSKDLDDAMSLEKCTQHEDCWKVM